MCARNRQINTSVYHLIGQEYISATSASVTCGHSKVGLQKHSNFAKNNLLMPAAFRVIILYHDQRACHWEYLNPNFLNNN